ncbi:MAG: Flagellar biosynthesis, basal-body outer-rane (lipopolysaccharide layer) ring protein [Bacteriovoracaceae bacterium]|nr:Flagellar biosynthesis, basal-body outer-rane (lipopolysaccharide layer) ring protein [Bacteriovoracaceae bacterium]
MKKSANKFLMIALFAFGFSACSFYKPHKDTFNEAQLKQQEERVKAGQSPNAEVSNEMSADPIQASLWAKSVGSPVIFRNQKAQKVGDLLTIVVNEDATATTAANTDTKKQSTVDITAGLTAGQGTSSQLGVMEMKGAHQNDFKGQGTTDRSGKFTTTVQAVVENVLPNGTLFVRGHKAITINKEDQEIEISGFVRPDDIRINNTVISTVMADAQIRYIGEGQLSDKQGGGWGAKLLDLFWPF